MVNLDAKIIAREYPDLDTIIQALVLVAIEHVRQMNSDFLSEAEFVKDGLPTLKGLKDNTVDYILSTVPDMVDKKNFNDLVESVVTDVLKSDPSLIHLTYVPKRDL